MFTAVVIDAVRAKVHIAKVTLVFGLANLVQFRSLFTVEDDEVQPA